jgi:hypothetical protein
MAYIQALLHKIEVPNHIKADIFNAQSIENQKLLLDWILNTPIVLQYYLTTVEIEPNDGGLSMMYLTDFFMHLNKKAEIAEYLGQAAQIIVDKGGFIDLQCFSEAYPDIVMPVKSAAIYPEHQTFKHTMRRV